jgi:hypothetical protein
MLLHHSLLHNSCYHYRVDNDALRYIENYGHYYNFKKVALMMFKSLMPDIFVCSFVTAVSIRVLVIPPPPTYRAHVSKGWG